MAFLAVVLLTQEFEKRKLYGQFTSVRARFEDFLLEHRTFPSQIAIKYRGGYTAAKALQELYLLIIDVLLNEGDVVQTLRSNEEFSFLRLDPDIDKGRKGKAFSEPTKSTAYLRDALRQELKCKICGGLIYTGSFSIDHKIRKSEGGTDSVDNAQLSHLYCNTTYKG